jgi:hypothetical protein
MITNTVGMLRVEIPRQASMPSTRLLENFWVRDPPKLRRKKANGGDHYL